MRSLEHFLWGGGFMVHLQESLHQRVLHFLFGANRKKVFCDSFAWT